MPDADTTAGAATSATVEKRIFVGICAVVSNRG
jgi:hypothetical protein